MKLYANTPLTLGHKGGSTSTVAENEPFEIDDKIGKGLLAAGTARKAKNEAADDEPKKEEAKKDGE